MFKERAHLTDFKMRTGIEMSFVAEIIRSMWEWKFCSLFLSCFWQQIPGKLHVISFKVKLKLILPYWRGSALWTILEWSIPISIWYLRHQRKCSLYAVLQVKKQMPREQDLSTYNCLFLSIYDVLVTVEPWTSFSWTWIHECVYSVPV